MLRGRVVVVSPHIDDAILSLGASIARSTRAGARVEVLTVLAGDPDSEVPAGRWDTRAGFSSAGEAARARRVEDRRACDAVGASASWLPFADGQYDRPDADAVHGAVARHLLGADLTLLPGYPLTHPDHAWLVEIMLARPLSTPLAFYVEWPYAHTPLTRGERPGLPGALASLVPRVEWRAVDVRPRDLLAQWRGVRQYRSQIAHLAGLLGKSRVTSGQLVWAKQRAGGEIVGHVPEDVAISTDTARSS